MVDLVDPHVDEDLSTLSVRKVLKAPSTSKSKTNSKNENKNGSTDHVNEKLERPAVSLIALGCAKNTVDAEVMLGDIEQHGIDVIDRPEDADIVIVNTCAFIEDAKRGSIEAILDVSKMKEDRLKGIIVTGCLAQRYAKDLAQDMPEVDFVVGFENYTKIPSTILEFFENERQKEGSASSASSPRKTLSRNAKIKADRVAVGGATVPFRPEYIRKRLTPKHTAFLRVAEGCDHACTFCAIPSFRGKFRSKPWDQVLQEAKLLAASGVKELNLIAEDTNQYGMDFGSNDPRRLHDLLYALAEIPELAWIRLLYCYPSYFSDELVQAIKEIPKVVKYIDIPLQHISDPVLKAMQRPSKMHTTKILNRLREEIPDITLRTTFISGFPGETKDDHKELVKFIKEFKFVRAGVFGYSEEEGTPAALMQDQFIDEDVKQARVDELISVQQNIEETHAKAQVGKVMDVIIDRIEEGYSIGRTMSDAPEIDSMVHILQQIEPGTILPVRIVGNHAFDLIGDSNLDAAIIEDDDEEEEEEGIIRIA